VAASVSSEAGTSAVRLRIGDWRVDSTRNELARGTESVRLEPKVIEVLVRLAAKPGEVVSREELLAAVWPGVVVGDDALTQAIIKLRKAFGDDAHKPTYIETISKRGYRLIALVEDRAAKATVGAPQRAWRPVALICAGAVAAGALTFLVLAYLGKVSPAPWPIAAEKGPRGLVLPTVAVLPLANLSGDPKREYFSDGVTEDVINALGRFPGLRVMSRNAVQKYKDKPAAPQAIGADLRVRYIVQGSVREADGRIRVAVEIAEAENGALLGSATREGASTEVFDIQDRIVRSIAGKLHVQVGALERQRVSGKPAESLEAYDLLLRARALITRNSRSNNREARALLARAAQLAPDYADIYTAMGSAEFQRATDGWIEDAAASTRRAEDLAKRALASPDTRAHVRAHSLLSSIYSHEERHEEALAHSQRAIDLNPSDATALYWRGSASLWLGRIDEAIRFLETARRIEPAPSAGQLLNLAIAYYITSRFADSIVEADSVIATVPHNPYAHAMRAAALAGLGNMQEARRTADKVRSIDPLFNPDNFASRFADRQYTAKVREGLRQAGL